MRLSMLALFRRMVGVVVLCLGVVGLLRAQAVFPFSFQEVSGAAVGLGAASGAPAVAGLPNAWAGGLNAAHIAVLDLNGDGMDDLLVFDRNGKLPLCFLYDPAASHVGASGSGAVAGGAENATPYVYAPAYAALLPPLREWVQACDYNGDGLPDLFTFNGVAGIRVYRNASRWETDTAGTPVYRLSFELLTDRLQARMYGQYGDLYCISVDYPALVDVDGDGAMDVLNFWVPSTGDYLHYYRNYALETYGTADSMDLRIEDWSWGCFAENEESNGIYLDSCRPAADGAGLAGVGFGIDCGVLNGVDAKAHAPKHSGSTLCALPRFSAAGRVYDLLLGDVGYDGLMYLHNGGTPDQARMTAYDSLFPAAEPVRLTSMPVVSVLPSGVAAAMGWDTARTHICVSPYNTDAFSTQGCESLWVYALDGGTDAGTVSGGLASVDAASVGSGIPAAMRLQTDFLQAGMIDHGALSCPTFFDYNDDGLLDIVVGYAGDPAAGNGVLTADACGGLALYENVGTPTEPAFRFVTDDFLGLKRGGLCVRALCPAFGDYDGDGRPEMVLGTFDGRLLAYGLRYDEGGAAEAVLRDSLFLGLETSGNTAPAIFDIDGDGLLDVVVGCKQQMWVNAAGRRYTKASLIYYRNTGETDEAVGHPFVKMTDSLGGVDVIDRLFSNYGYARPAFYRSPSAAAGRAAAPAYLLCGAENGRIKAYAFDGRQWRDTFVAAGDLPWWSASAVTAEVAASTATRLWVGEHSAPAWADLDGDGLPDLVVGNARGGLQFAKGIPFRPATGLSNERPGRTPEAAASAVPFASLSPNPAGETVSLRLDRAAAYTVADPAGRPCRAGRLPAGSHTLSLAGLPAGLYLLYLRAEIQSSGIPAASATPQTLAPAATSPTTAPASAVNPPATAVQVLKLLKR